MVGLCLTVAPLGGTKGAGRPAIDGRPADVERMVEVCSMKFLPNAGEGDRVALAEELML